MLINTSIKSIVIPNNQANFFLLSIKKPNKNVRKLGGNNIIGTIAMAVHACVNITPAAKNIQTIDAVIPITTNHQAAIFVFIGRETFSIF